jgi:quinol monooxygenase YgiN
VAFALIARWTAREGEEQAVAAAVKALVAPSRSEPGNLYYQPHRDPRDPRVFMIYEQYEDEAAYAAHGESEHFRRHAIDDAIPRLAGRERWFYKTL